MQYIAEECVWRNWNASTLVKNPHPYGECMIIDAIQLHKQLENKLTPSTIPPEHHYFVIVTK